MKLSNLFFRSLRDAPTEADIASHQLLLRGSFIRQLGAGLFDYLPLGLKVKRNLERIIREEMESIGSQEVSFPVVQPAELWRRSGRWDAVGADLTRFQDRAGRDLCLALTHEEAMTEAAAGIVQSYKQLPVSLYQLQTKFRDEPRARAGLIRLREFTMKDAYSFDTDETSFEVSYKAFYDAYFRIFKRCGLDVIAVESDTGMMGGGAAHEYMYLTPIGEDTLLICPNGDYSANRQVALFEAEVIGGETLDIEEVATPDAATIAALADFLNVSESQTAKAVFLMAEIDGSEQFVFCVLRGDRELNETKLANVIAAKSLRPATPEEIRIVGAEPGYGSPIGIKREAVLLVVDELVAASTNLVAGANKSGYHLLNTNYGRDYEADLVVDISAAADGDACPCCGAAMRAERGVEVGNIFKLGTIYSEALGADFLDAAGKRKPLFMGSYGIGVDRLLACIVERHHDAAGMIWSAELAPYQVSLLSLGKSEEVAARATQIYETLTISGYSVLFDERAENPGVKFKNADLIGAPLRITVGSKGLQRGVVEVKARAADKREDVLVGEVLEYVTDHLPLF